MPAADVAFDLINIYRPGCDDLRLSDGSAVAAFDSVQRIA